MMQRVLGQVDKVMVVTDSIAAATQIINHIHQVALMSTPPHLTHDSVGHKSASPQWHLNQFSCFLHGLLMCPTDGYTKEVYDA